MQSMTRGERFWWHFVRATGGFLTLSQASVLLAPFGEFRLEVFGLGVGLLTGKSGYELLKLYSGRAPSSSGPSASPGSSSPSSPRSESSDA